jgi:hypothetical protein
MSLQFFRAEESLYMFDPDTFQVHRFEDGRWVPTDDLSLRENIRFRSVEVSCPEVQQAACG